jgi:hypothetical protein
VNTLVLAPGGELPAPGAALQHGLGAAGGLPLHSLAVRADAREVAVGGADGTVAVIDVVAGRALAAARLHDGEVRSLHACGPLLLSAGGDGTLAVSMVSSAAAGGGGVAKLAAARHALAKALCARWQPGAAALASSGSDGLVVQWTLAAADS